METGNLHHPIMIVDRLGGRESQGLVFEFSRYHYIPRAIADTRSIVRVPSGSVTEWFEKEKSKLGPDEDIAFHSRVQVNNNGGIRHVPMIDFKEIPSKEDFKRVHSTLGELGIPDYWIYHSGRSFHLYGLTLMENDEWVRFLGRILLLNMPGQKEIIDSRWVGHRLMGGYGTLRWTKNNPHYAGLPTRINLETFFEGKGGNSRLTKRESPPGASSLKS